jgi:hypothetical protein
LQVLLSFRHNTRRLGLDANRPYLPDNMLGKVPLFLDPNAYYQCLAEPIIDRPVDYLPHAVKLFITDLVVVGDLVGSGEAQERGVIGETPNLAARLQALAEPGAVVIAAATRRLTGGLFDYRDLGATTLKGFAGNVPAWQVLGGSAIESRFEAMRTAMTPLIGRDEEIDLLMRRWEQAIGCVVLISGEPGIGKSRIAQTVVERLSPEPHTRLRYFCSPHHQDSAFYPYPTGTGGGISSRRH